MVRLPSLRARKRQALNTVISPQFTDTASDSPPSSLKGLFPQRASPRPPRRDTHPVTHHHTAGEGEERRTCTPPETKEERNAGLGEERARIIPDGHGSPSQPHVRTHTPCRTPGVPSHPNRKNLRMLSYSPPNTPAARLPPPHTPALRLRCPSRRSRPVRHPISAAARRTRRPSRATKNIYY